VKGKFLCLAEARVKLGIGNTDDEPDRP